LVPDNMLPGKNLYLLATGTGLAPFMSIIKDPEIYDQFEKIILAHGVREVSELAYSDYIENILPNDEYLGERSFDYINGVWQVIPRPRSASSNSGR